MIPLGRRSAISYGRAWFQKNFLFNGFIDMGAIMLLKRKVKATNTYWWSGLGSCHNAGNLIVNIFEV